MPIVIPILVLLGLIILVAALWFIWQLVKCAVVLIIVAVIVGILWYLGSLDAYLPSYLRSGAVSLISVL